MRAAWADVELIINPYKEQKDVYVLGAVDDVLVVLDETTMIVQSVSGSPYVGPLLPDVTAWERRLTLLAETLEEWQACPRDLHACIACMTPLAETLEEWQACQRARMCLRLRPSSVVAVVVLIPPLACLGAGVPAIVDVY